MTLCLVIVGLSESHHVVSLLSCYN